MNMALFIPGQELYEKFMCYCKTSGGDLDASISAAEAIIMCI
jgi:hypothetical protein